MSLEQAIRDNDTEKVLTLAPVRSMLTYVGKREIMKRDLFCAFDYTPEINWIVDKIRGQMILNEFSQLDVVVNGFDINSLKILDIDYNLSFYHVCLYGTIETIQWFCKTYDLNLYQDHVFSIKAHDQYAIKIPPYICVIALGGNVDTFRHFQPDVEKTKGALLAAGLLEFAIHSGKVDMVRHIVETYDIQPDKCLYSGTVEIDAYLTDKGFDLQDVPQPEKSE